MDFHLRKVTPLLPRWRLGRTGRSQPASREVAHGQEASARSGTHRLGWGAERRRKDW